MKSLLTAIALMLVATSCSRDKGDSRAHLLTSTQADALKAKILLTELRAGRLTNALELLEEEIDSSVVIINGLAKVAGPERDRALGTLRAIKAYREKHPRETEAVILDAPLGDATQKATQILAELK